MAAGRTVLRGTFRADGLESVNPIELVGLSQFDEMRTSERTKLIDLKSVYGISDLRDIITTAGSGAVTNTVGSGEYKLVTTANGADVAVLESAERGRYVAGASGEPGLAVRLADTPTGDQVVRWGYFDDDNGFGFGRDATGIFSFTRKGGTDTEVRQADWNNDTLTGNGGSANPSKLELELSAGNTFQMPFTYYGYGPCYFEVLINDSDGRQRKIDVHRYARTSGLVVEDPNLPLRAEVRNGGTANAFDALYVGGRQFSVVGRYTPNRRVTSEYRLALGSVGETFLPTVSLRRKSAYKSVSVKLEGIDIITDADLIYQARVNSTLTGASYAALSGHPATETALEADNSATAISGGIPLYTGLVDASGTGGNATGGLNIQGLGFDIPALQPLTLAVRQVSGTGGTVTVIVRAREEW